MLFGLLLHGATIGSNPLFDAVKLTSEHFRMATFFLISGFFTAMVCSRSDLRAYLVNRGRLILVPFVAGVLLLNPVTNWLIQLYHDGGESLVDYIDGGWRLPLPGPTVWHLHLWFLISLFVYAVLTPPVLALAGSGRADRAVAWLAQRPAAAQLLVMTLVVALCVTGWRAIAAPLLVP
ncbi:MAG: acyltransferase family protein, partial [Sandaracinobacter sp.]